MEPTGDTRQRIIDAAAKVIESEGESSLRLRDVAAIVGIAEPSLYYYFANREELITASNAERYRRSIAVIGPFVAGVGHATNKAEFVDAVKRTYESAFLPERRAARALRAELIGSAIYRPDLYEQISEMTRQALDDGVKVLRTAQENGWLRADIDAEAFCLWTMAHMSSIIYAEMRNDERLLLEFKKIGHEAVAAFLKD